MENCFFLLVEEKPLVAFSLIQATQITNELWSFIIIIIIIIIIIVIIIITMFVEVACAVMSCKREGLNWSFFRLVTTESCLYQIFSTNLTSAGLHSQVICNRHWFPLRCEVMWDVLPMVKGRGAWHVLFIALVGVVIHGRPSNSQLCGCRPWLSSTMYHPAWQTLMRTRYHIIMNGLK